MVETGLRVFYGVLGDWVLDLPDREARELARKLKNHIVRCQADEGLPSYWLEVIETEGGMHFNVVFVGSERVVHRLRTSKLFGDCLDIQPADDRLCRWYLSKEGTPQAKYALSDTIGPRRRGSHRLEGGGDRVRLSKALEADCLAAGMIEPWKRSYAKRVYPPDDPPQRKTTSRKNPEAVTKKVPEKNHRDNTPKGAEVQASKARNPANSQPSRLRPPVPQPGVTSRPGYRPAFPRPSSSPHSGSLERVRPPSVPSNDESRHAGSPPLPSRKENRCSTMM